MIWLFIYLLFVHWVADFVMQDNDTAIRKGKSDRVLFGHVYVYTVVLFLVTMLYPVHVSLFTFLWFALLNGALHWITDRITSRINARLWVRGTATTPPNLHRFFVSVGADQLIHTTTLLLTAYWLLT